MATPGSRRIHWLALTLLAAGLPASAQDNGGQPIPYFGDNILFNSNASGFAAPRRVAAGEWAQVIMVNSKWMVLENEAGQQFPVELGNGFSFIIRWPTSLANLTPASMVEANGPDVGSNQIMVNHLDVFEGTAQGMVTPTYQQQNGFALVLSPNGLGRTGVLGPTNTVLSGVWNAPNESHIVGPPISLNPLMLGIGGQNTVTILPGNSGSISMTQVTQGSPSFIRKGDLAYVTSSGMTPRSLQISNLVLYKTIPLNMFQP